MASTVTNMHLYDYDIVATHGSDPYCASEVHSKGKLTHALTRAPSSQSADEASPQHTTCSSGQYSSSLLYPPLCFQALLLFQPQLAHPDPSKTASRPASDRGCCCTPLVTGCPEQHHSVPCLYSVTIQQHKHTIRCTER